MRKALGSLSLLIVALLKLACSGSDRSDWQLISWNTQVRTGCPGSCCRIQPGNRACPAAAAALDAPEWPEMAAVCPAREGDGGAVLPLVRHRSLFSPPPRQSGFCPGEDVVGIADLYLPVGKGLSEML